MQNLGGLELDEGIISNLLGVGGGLIACAGCISWFPD
jgi:hypothetical protein